MKTRSLLTLLVVALSLPLLAVSASAVEPSIYPSFDSSIFHSIFPGACCQLPIHRFAAFSLAPVAEKPERPSGPVSDSINPNVVIPDTTDTDGYRLLSFNDLAGWEYIYPDSVLNFGMWISSDAALEDRLPDPIMALDSQQISVIGFMMPIKITRKGVTEFLLVRNMMICCYGVAPKMNEWIIVRTAEDEPLKFYPNVPVRVRGLFRIDEQIDQRYVAQLFTMTADDLEIVVPKGRSRPGFMEKRFGQ